LTFPLPAPPPLRPRRLPCGALACFWCCMPPARRRRPPMVFSLSLRAPLLFRRGLLLVPCLCSRPRFFRRCLPLSVAAAPFLAALRHAALLLWRALLRRRVAGRPVGLPSSLFSRPGPAAPVAAVRSHMFGSTSPCLSFGRLRPPAVRLLFFSRLVLSRGVAVGALVAALLSPSRGALSFRLLFFATRFACSFLRSSLLPCKRGSGLPPRLAAFSIPPPL